jgi:hypothetical protein
LLGGSFGTLMKLGYPSSSRHWPIIYQVRKSCLKLNQKDKMLEALTTLTKPQSSKWEDFEIWWNQLNVQDKGKAMSDSLLADVHWRMQAK